MAEKGQIFTQLKQLIHLSLKISARLTGSISEEKVFLNLSNNICW
jgi:hypothetical protein